MQSVGCRTPWLMNDTLKNMTALAELEKQAQTMIDDLLWWTRAVKAARQA
jgi:hypothetical protein